MAGALCKQAAVQAHRSDTKCHTIPMLADSQRARAKALPIESRCPLNLSKRSTIIQSNIKQINVNKGRASKRAYRCAIHSRCRLNSYLEVLEARQIYNDIVHYRVHGLITITVDIVVTVSYPKDLSGQFKT